MSSRKIKIGYIHMSSWTSKSNLADDCYFDPNSDWYNERSAVEVRALDPKEVVLKMGTYTLKIDYPLSTPYVEEFTTTPNGLTRHGLVNIIVRAYKKIYATAEKDNPHGVWGHCMSDLMLHTARVSPKGNISVDCDS